MLLAWLWLAVSFAAPFYPTAAMADPESDYVLHCQGCHGPDGGGSVDGAPPFRGNLARFARTERGRAYLLRVPGVAHAELDDEHMAALLNWILSRFDPGASDVRPFTVEEVRAGRREPLLSVPSARSRALGEGKR